MRNIDHNILYILYQMVFNPKVLILLYIQLKY